MVPNTPTTWTGGLDLPSRLFGSQANRANGTENSYELYEEDDQFVLTIDLPGYEPEEISLRWYDGRLNVSAEHVDDERGRREQTHRTFRMPKDVLDDDIEASYRNGVLEITLPIEGEFTAGKQIPIES